MKCRLAVFVCSLCAVVQFVSAAFPDGYYDKANGKSKAEHALWVKEHLEALVGVIPEIKSMFPLMNSKKTDCLSIINVIATASK